MSRDKDYQRLLNSKQWKRLRQWQLQREPLCEICKLEGIVTSAIDVHHKVPVESAHNLDDMARTFGIAHNILSQGCAKLEERCLKLLFFHCRLAAGTQ